MTPNRFTILLTLRDRFGEQQVLQMACSVDEAMSINLRAVEELKMGVVPFDEAVQMMKRREFRKEVFIAVANRLARQMVDRMEDAEGWHDTSRIEPARRILEKRVSE